MMEIIGTIVGITLSTVVGCIVYRLRKMEKDIEDKISKRDVRYLIEDKLAVHKVILEEVRKDVTDLVRKLDKLISTKH